MIRISRAIIIIISRAIIKSKKEKYKRVVWTMTMMNPPPRNLKTMAPKTNLNTP